MWRGYAPRDHLTIHDRPRRGSHRSGRGSHDGTGGNRLVRHDGTGGCRHDSAGPGSRIF
jgi:hypothetical protein